VDMDAMETFNASLVFGSGNRLARDFSRENNLAFTAGSDSHRAEFIGRGYVEINDNILSEKDLISAIFGKKNRVGGKPLNWLEILKNGSNANLNEAFRNYKFKRRNRRKKIK
jgi:predicted metal-dependent phosphoesterase TrpH